MNLSSPIPGSKNSKAISLSLLVYIAWRNLVTKKLRTFLTVLGIIVGIGAIFFLLSFGLGLQNLVTQQVIGDESIKTISVNSSNSKIIKLNNETVSKITALGHIEKSTKSYSLAGSISANGSEFDTVVYGIDHDYFTLNGLSFATGKGLDSASVNTVVINKTIVRSLNLSKESDAIGKSILLNIPLQNADAREESIKKSFKIVGVIDTTTGTETYIASGIFDGAGVPVYNQLKITADHVENVSELRKQIESLSFQTTSPIDTLDQINQVFRYFTFALVGLGAIGMLVAILGMFNTLTISLLERTREIGLMFALGARRRDVYRLFVLEAVILSFAGAVIGIICSVVASRIIDLVMNSFARGRGVTQGFELFATPWWLILGTITLMVIVGLMVVIFPARRARSINPIDALRRD